MTKDEERALAQRYGAAVVGYTQYENLCRGYVAWWLRRRIKNAAGTKPSNFFVAPRFQALSPMPGQQFKGSRFELDNEEKSKPHLLAGIFANDLAAMHQYIATGDAPGKAQKDRRALVSKPAHLIPEKLDGGRRLSDVVEHASADRCVLYIRMLCDAKLDHAVGLDLLAGKSVTFFDPGLGEFAFAALDPFIRWWSECYAAKDDAQKSAAQASAFKLYNGAFEWACYKLL